jgi:outer membrane protein assembly factor BamD (BamD/ComL family)
METVALEEARAAVQARDFGRASRVLDAHDAAFPAGALAPEAMVLRIEAARGAGDVRGARQLAEAFLREHPESPLTARVRGLLVSMSNP